MTRLQVVSVIVSLVVNLWAIQLQLRCSIHFVSLNERESFIRVSTFLRSEFPSLMRILCSWCRRAERPGSRSLVIPECAPPPLPPTSPPAGPQMCFGDN